MTLDIQVGLLEVQRLLTKFILYIYLFHVISAVDCIRTKWPKMDLGTNFDTKRVIRYVHYTEKRGSEWVILNFMIPPTRRPTVGRLTAD